jgi:hypothetical protein
MVGGAAQAVLGNGVLDVLRHDIRRPGNDQRALSGITAILLSLR